ncbi:MAG TPA: phosphoadenylyl-sulfate reductase [Segeticoccus sp.]|uniref:phosphoadenylyl-sulfate reductase n=1 Tax=Segeticoccus sp. TaxID=2706531 RepID=UPI002D81158B|nr:phosphoadenylyl-sulfate reductase [Segeticoccus sp.]HET8600943.1 phosphoadenylyl-sulfate reductase [Segeticoccus sp.]
MTAPAALRGRRSDQRSRRELEVLAAEAARRLADADAVEVVAWAAEAFGDRLVVASSMEHGVLAHLVAQELPGVDVLFLDTGYHFAETIGTRDALEATLPVTVLDVRPRLTVAEQDRRHGTALHTTDPDACCRLRKVEPLAEQLDGYEAWVTGLRREESPLRADTPVVQWDERHGLVKVNPLADWTLDDLISYAAVHDVVVNPLLAEGYPSIGCAPCTRRVVAGEDPRSGRWAGIAKTECGIHR